VQFVSVPEVGVPKSGVTNVGLVASALAPDPVLVVTPVPPLETPNVPVTPVDNGRPVAFVRTPDAGVPNAGVTNVALVMVGLVPNTLAPEPVLVVTPVPPLETPSVPVTPVDKGRPVQLVSVPEVGVPSNGVTNVGDVFKTLLPEPVLVVTPVPPLETPSVPVIPVDKGRPVQLVSVPEVGMPSSGVTKVGLVARTTEPVPVAVVTPVPPDVTGSALTNDASVAANNGVTTEVEYTLALAIFVPLLYTRADIVVGIATPVPVEFLIVIVSAVSFCTI
jgi:hypothetical protein